MRRNKERIPVDKWKIVAVICAVIAVMAAIVLIFLLKDFYEKEEAGEAKIEELRVEVVSEKEMEAVEHTESESLLPIEATPTPMPLVKNPYADAFVQNADMAFWLTVDGTNIDYPVMQTPEDEEYYLRRDFYGNDDTAGCLLLTADCAVYGESQTTNLIIHGHNMKAGTMFGHLMEYEEEEYGREHKHMKIYTRTDKREYEVVSVFYSQVYYPTDLVFKYYNFFQADSETEFDYFYDNIKEMSLYDTGVTAKLGDHFLTLSTCSYHVEDGRFVVVAKEVSRQELYESPADEK